MGGERRPLFVTGLTRGGTSLVARTLDAHPAVALAVDPFLPLHRDLRSGLLADAPAEVRAAHDPKAPFQDFYFRRDGLAVMDRLHAADGDPPVDPETAAALPRALAARVRLECPDLESAVPDLPAPTWGGWFDNMLDVVAARRGGAETRWVGTKEVWIIDNLPWLARRYPEARFIVVLRDPRDTLASILSVVAAGAAPPQHMVSILRHWRKYAALATTWTDADPFGDRLLVLRYEELVLRPEDTTRRLSGFLGLPHDPAMTRFEALTDPATGRPWNGNSFADARAAGLNSRTIGRRNRLDRATIRLAEFLCGPEARLAGYADIDPDVPVDAEMMAVMRADAAAPVDWRSDRGDFPLDLGGELVRHALLAARPSDLDETTARSCFLTRAAAGKLLSAPSGKERS